MAHPSRRVPPPSSPQEYYAVPQSPRSQGHGPANSMSQPYGPRPSGRSPSIGGSSQMHNSRGAMAQGVATGAIGGGYGPYSYHPSNGRDQGGYQQQQQASRFSSAPPSEASVVTSREKMLPPPVPNSNTVPPYLWDTKDPDLDDALHNPDPIRDAAADHSWTIFSFRGWINALALFVLLAGLIVLFAGYPIIAFYRRAQLQIPGYNLGGINGTGQVPKLPGMPSLIDVDTDSSVYTRKGSDGKTYNLVFSDEFNTDGRSFYPGDDPYWEAVDLQYWPTGDLEWYDPQGVTTKDGKLVITLQEFPNHDLNFQSAMLSTWNKFCFTTGYIEVSISMPGSANTPGLWPAAWTMGNLGRAGYGATTEGMWPYSYDTCDLGTFPNQTGKDGTPAAAATGSPKGTEISFLPGQRLSACTCPGSDHPGPTTSNGRGVPEIDIIETQINTAVMRGQVSQSFQTAPYNYQYEFVNTTPATTIYDDTQTSFNVYKGGIYQQAVSAVTFIDSQNYNDNGYAPYGYEWWSDPSHRDQGYVTWYSGGVETFTMEASAIGPDSITQISQRLIPEEPMYILLNLGLSPSFQKQDWKNLKFPSQMFVDYVRVYQREDVSNTNGVGCNPPNYPTSDYINNHLVAYTNPNLTTWEQANFTFPRNSLYDGC